MLRFIFVAIAKRHGAAKLQQIVNDTNCDLGKFISDGNFSQWLEVNVSVALRFGQASCSLLNMIIYFQKFASMVRHGTNGIADVMAKVKLMLDEKKTHDLIISYINVSTIELVVASV